MAARTSTSKPKKPKAPRIVNSDKWGPRVNRQTLSDSGVLVITYVPLDENGNCGPVDLGTLPAYSSEPKPERKATPRQTTVPTPVEMDAGTVADSVAKLQAQIAGIAAALDSLTS